MPRGRISPITMSTARQRSASSIAHSTSRPRAAATVINRSGAIPIPSRAGPSSAPCSAIERPPAIQSTADAQALASLRASHELPSVVSATRDAMRAASASAKPLAAATSVSRAAAISCSAPKPSPPPSAPSITGLPSASSASHSPAIVGSSAASCRRSSSMRTGAPSTRPSTREECRVAAMILVHGLFLLIPELAAGVKRRHKLLKNHLFSARGPRAETIDVAGAPRFTLPLRNDAAVDLAHAFYPAQRHGHVELARENVDRGGDSCLASRAEAIDVGASDHARARAAAERAHHVLPGADAAVDHHLDHVAHCVHHLRQCRDRGGRPVELPAAVIGDDERAGAGLCGRARILDVEDPLEDEFARPE